MRFVIGKRTATVKNGALLPAGFSGEEVKKNIYYITVKPIYSTRFRSESKTRQKYAIGSRYENIKKKKKEKRNSPNFFYTYVIVRITAVTVLSVTAVIVAVVVVFVFVVGKSIRSYVLQ